MQKLKWFLFFIFSAVGWRKKYYCGFQVTKDVTLRWCWEQRVSWFSEVFVYWHTIRCKLFLKVKHKTVKGPQQHHLQRFSSLRLHCRLHQGFVFSMFQLFRLICQIFDFSQIIYLLQSGNTLKYIKLGSFCSVLTSVKRKRTEAGIKLILKSIFQWLSCIMGNVGSGFWKAVRWSNNGLLWHCWSHYAQFNNKLSKAIQLKRYRHFNSMSLDYPQCNFASRWHPWRDVMWWHQLLLRPQNDLFYFSNICSSTPANTH